MINTRLVYIQQPQKSIRLAAVIEQVDNLLDEALYMEKLHQKMSLYGLVDSDEVYVGREVIGREENLYNHDIIKIQDFAANTSQKDYITYASFEELVNKAKDLAKSHGHSHFRIQVDLDDFEGAEVYFFTNLEKYIGPAAA